LCIPIYCPEFITELSKAIRSAAWNWCTARVTTEIKTIAVPIIVKPGFDTKALETVPKATKLVLNECIQGIE
jgi:hypothetical protein